VRKIGAKLPGRGKIPLLYAHWERLIPARQLWLGPSDPLLHFLRWPLEYLAYLPILRGMREDAWVLELGCNHEGLDILKTETQFAQKHIYWAYAHGGCGRKPTSSPMRMRLSLSCMQFVSRHLKSNPRRYRRVI